MGMQKLKQKLAIPALNEYPNGTLASELAEHVIRTAIVSLSAAQIIGMNATPVSLLAAPGAGKAIVDLSIVFEMNATATQFTGGGAVSAVYHGGAVSPHAGSVPAAVVQAGAGQTLTQLGPAVGSNGITVPANTGVDLTNATAAFATGTGTAKVFVKYRVITL